LTDNFRELYACSYGYEVQLDIVDRASWLDVDVAPELITVDPLRSVVSLVADNQEVGDTTA
jgi:hypothetical protein